MKYMMMMLKQNNIKKNKNIINIFNKSLEIKIMLNYIVSIQKLWSII